MDFSCGILNPDKCLATESATATKAKSKTMSVLQSEPHPKTLVDTFLVHVATAPDRRFMTQPLGGGELKLFTFSQVFDEARRIAAYLQSLGFEKGSRIALCSKSCAWWIICDIAIWLSGHVSVPVYPTLTAETVQYILDHSESKLLFIGKLDEHPWNEMKHGVNKDMPTVTFPLSPAQEHGQAGEGNHETWDSLIQKCEPIQDICNRTPEEMATIIYTSGSSGRPKGVMHDFRTMFVTTVSIVQIFNGSEKDRYLSYLPLAHGMERWLGECTALYCGGDLFFAESIQTFVEDLKRASPTVFVSVPRLWSKFQQGVYSKMPPKKLDFYLSIPIFNIFVKKKILKELGLDKVRIAGSGSAPIPKELIQWYKRLDLEVLEGYGMTENFNYSHFNRPGNVLAGTVGQPYDHVQVRISSPNSEIQVKGPGTMIGYYKNPEATNETMTEDGFLKTGDTGEIDSVGRLTITGRIKELFKTSKGKYVAPAPIETKLTNHPKVELACVCGESFPQPHAIVQLSEHVVVVVKSGKSSNDVTTTELEEHLKSVNSTLDPHEQLDFMVVVKDEWLPENGFLTPTFKIVRRKIEEMYNPHNKEWYESTKKIIWYGWE
jgi:long-chain acyl-CoA synthetase